MNDETDFGDVLITDEAAGGAALNVRKSPTPRYARTSDSADTLAYQAGIRLLRGESWVSIESSLHARGIGDVDKIMELACQKALGK